MPSRHTAIGVLSPSAALMILQPIANKSMFALPAPGPDPLCGSAVVASTTRTNGIAHRRALNARFLSRRSDRAKLSFH